MDNKRYDNKNTKRYYIIMSFIFIIFIVVIVVFNILKKDILFSESENRILAKKPKFTVEKLVEGKFPKKYEKYKIDQFINRDLWIEVKTSFDKMLGKNKSNGVYLSKYNYLIEEFKEPNSKIIKSNLDTINKFSDKHKNIKQHFIIAPNAIEILENNLPIFAPTVSQKKYIDDFKDKLSKNVNFIDAYKALKDHNKEYIYYKTDHHWTTLGSYYTFLEAANSMNLNIEKIKYDVKKVSDSFFGTLSSKSGYKAKESDYIDVYIPENKNDEYVVNYVEEQKKSASFYDSSKLSVKDKYSVFLGGNHPLTKIKTTSKEDRRLLIFKDSYANNFIPFLTPHFKEIVVVDPRYYYDDIDKLIEEEKTTDILFLYNANTFFFDTSLELVLNNK